MDYFHLRELVHGSNGKETTQIFTGGGGGSLHCLEMISLIYVDISKKIKDILQHIEDILVIIKD